MRPKPPTDPTAAAGWPALHRRRRRPLEFAAEMLIAGVSQTAIAVIFLIFLFVGREALPILTGRLSTATPAHLAPLDPGVAISMPPDRLREYLGMTEAEFAGLDPETLRALLELRHQSASEVSSDPDAKVNTLSWRYLILPHAWADYDAPAYVWQPVSRIQKFNLIPLVAGSLKVTLVALVVAVPLALGAAIYVSRIAPPRLAQWLKPAIELLASVPSVVIGAFAALVLASGLQSLFDTPYRLNASVAGIALGLAAVPLVFSIAENALSQVPQAYSRGAIALGATPWQATAGVVIPAAIPGLTAAVILGFGRCISETMVVLIASGNAALLSPNLLDPARTLTATIAAELGETVVGGHHYRMLFVIGTLLFFVSFLTHTAAHLVLERLRRRLERLA